MIIESAQKVWSKDLAYKVTFRLSCRKLIHNLLFTKHITQKQKRKLNLNECYCIKL